MPSISPSDGSSSTTRTLPRKARLLPPATGQGCHVTGRRGNPLSTDARPVIDQPIHRTENAREDGHWAAIYGKSSQDGTAGIRIGDETRWRAHHLPRNRRRRARGRRGGGPTSRTA